MATSGSINLLATRDDIITEALEHIGVLADGETASANQLTTCSRTLNYMVKAWQNRGLGLWTIERVYLFLEKNKNEYSLGQATGDHFTTENPVDNTTTLSAAEASGQTVISLTAGAGSANSDNVMIELSSGSSHWTTISSGGGTNEITIAVALPSAASSGARVYWYTTKGNRPKVISHANRVTEPSDGSEVPIQIWTRTEYSELPKKTEDGSVLGLYYDPQITTGKLFVWPETSDVSNYLRLYVQRTINDYDAAANDSDFPQEWFNVLALGLAVHLCPKFGISSESFNQLARLFEIAMFDAEAGDREDTWLFEPDFSRS